MHLRIMHYTYWMPIELEHWHKPAQRDPYLFQSMEDKKVYLLKVYLLNYREEL